MGWSIREKQMKASVHPITGLNQRLSEPTIDYRSVSLMFDSTAEDEFSKFCGRNLSIGKRSLIDGFLPLSTVQFIVHLTCHTDLIKTMLKIISYLTHVCPGYVFGLGTNPEEDPTNVGNVPIRLLK